MQQTMLVDDMKLEDVAKFVTDGKCSNIVVLTGAGISTAAGIPDFRSPGTGLYHNLQKYNLPYPQAVFAIDYFLEQPEPFFDLVRTALPSDYKPTLAHLFVKLLHDKKVLLRYYTQNVDGLERTAGLPDDVIVEAHGTFHSSRCMRCQAVYDLRWLKEKLVVENVPVPLCSQCSSWTGTPASRRNIVKPDVVLFGEALPARFYERLLGDFSKCDLLIVMGTSLQVQPFASLVGRVKATCPRLYINLDVPADDEFSLGDVSEESDSEEVDGRDVFCKTTCDEGCAKLAELLGWQKDLEGLVSFDRGASSL